jgi:hypothetical protein
MRTAFNVASVAMALADGRAAIGTGSECLAHGFFLNLRQQRAAFVVTVVAAPRVAIVRLPAPAMPAAALCQQPKHSNNAAVSVSPFALRHCSASSRLTNRRVAQEVGAPTDAAHLHGFAPAAQRFPDDHTKPAISRKTLVSFSLSSVPTLHLMTVPNKYVSHSANTSTLSTKIAKALG